MVKDMKLLVGQFTHSDVWRPAQRIFLKTEEGRVLGVRPAYALQSQRKLRRTPGVCLKREIKDLKCLRLMFLLRNFCFVGMFI